MVLNVTAPINTLLQSKVDSANANLEELKLIRDTLSNNGYDLSKVSQQISKLESQIATLQAVLDLNP